MAQKKKRFCIRQFALHRQQPETHKQNIFFATSRKISAEAHGVAQAHAQNT